ncbi:MAG: vWA domain-containing protein [Pseudomonadota bacterium]
MATAPAQRPVRGEGGLLAANIVHFGRALRAAGLKIGPGQILDALEALAAVGIGSRRDFYWTLFAVFVKRADQRELFDQTFHIFWRDPQLLERLMQLMLPTLEGDNVPEGPRSEVSRRVADAMAPEKQPGEGEGDEPDEERVELDAVMTWSANEVLQTKDFEEMSQAEIELAKRAMQRLALPIAKVRTRRFDPHPHGNRVDLRRTLRGSLRGGGALIDLEKKRRRMRPPPLVVLCDISGSMSRYSRLLLHFLHALTNDRDRVYSFLFGTRLTNVTRQLKNRDIDFALDRIGEACTDWSGGTRIGHCLEQFNRVWGRRVLTQGAVVLLITDGLDRDAAENLEKEMDRLQRSCRRLIWLNPLLRFDGYAPLASGAKAMIRHVDAFHSVHNLESLDQLAHIMSQTAPTRGAMHRWVEASEGSKAA